MSRQPRRDRRPRVFGHSTATSDSSKANSVPDEDGSVESSNRPSPYVPAVRPAPETRRRRRERATPNPQIVAEEVVRAAKLGNLEPLGEVLSDLLRRLNAAEDQLASVSRRGAFTRTSPKAMRAPAPPPSTELGAMLRARLAPEQQAQAGGLTSPDSSTGR